MQRNDPGGRIRIEPRWPSGLAVIVVVLLLKALPGRISVYPAWAPYVLGIAVLTPMAGVGFTTGKRRWERLERTITFLFCVVVGAAILVSLTGLVGAMIRRPAEVSGLQLLASSVGVWVTNVLVFSLLYWQLDRGGPAARERGEATRPDWLFPQDGASAEAVEPGWGPTFLDYLFLGYSTATAFSTTDVMPLTTRAKMWMMTESTISLATLVLVASRAINILGS